MNLNIDPSELLNLAPELEFGSNDLLAVRLTTIAIAFEGVDSRLGFQHD